MDALLPVVLLGLYRETIDRWWDDEPYRAVLDQEEAERDALRRLVDEWDVSR